MKIRVNMVGGTLALMASAGLWALPLRAQEGSTEKPKPAARVLLPLPDLSGDQQDSDQDSQAQQPDHGPVTGIQSPTLGSPELRHSYWLPGIQYSNTAQSNSSIPGGDRGWITTSYMSGNLSLLEAWSHALLSTNYSGGGFVSNDPVQGKGQYHQFAAALQVDQRRWQALFITQFSYLPQSTFGFGGTSELSFPGITGALAVPLPQLQNSFVPGQSVFSASGPRYTNAGAAQLTYQLSPRGTITVAAVDGLLRFTNSGNISSDTETLNAGYNYAITRKDSLGMVYRFSAFHYLNNPQAVGDHLAQVVYGRRIVKRLGMNLGGGPEITTFRMPIAGSSKKVSTAGSASLTYSLARAKVGLDFMHGVSNGSGVFTGARTDLVSASLSRQFTRVWSGRLNFGYARNKQIVAISGLTSPIYDSWVPGAGLSRPLGRSAYFSIGYQAQIENSNVALCSTCGTNYTIHQIIMSFQWHAPPQVLR